MGIRIPRPNVWSGNPDCLIAVSGAPLTKCPPTGIDTTGGASMAKLEMILTPAFVSQIIGIADTTYKDRILRAVELLPRNRLPDGNQRKTLKGREQLFRLRIGDYRVIYRYDSGSIALLAVGHRHQIYDDIDVDTEDQRTQLTPTTPKVAANTRKSLAAHASDPLLPRPIDLTLLQDLRIPHEFHAPLLQCHTLNQLRNAEVPDDLLNWVFDCVSGISSDDADTLHEQKQLVLQEPGELRRIVDGEFVQLLLKLDAEQQQVIDDIGDAGGPALVTGGPGSGKSVVALYSARRMIESLRDSGVRLPQLLLTTFTTTLGETTRQQLRNVLGDDESRVEIATVDAIARRIIQETERRQVTVLSVSVRSTAEREAHSLLVASATTDREANELRRVFASIDQDVLHAEIGSVIEALEIKTFGQYLDERRRRRSEELDEIQCEVVWRFSETWRTTLRARNMMSWSQLRCYALQLVRSGAWPYRYHGAVVDEAQDLEVSALRLMASLCMNPRHLLFAGDSNQSIYRTWSSLERDLDLGERIRTLTTSHRSTPNIIYAANAYVAESTLDAQIRSLRFRASYGQRPFLRYVATRDDEATLLVTYFSWTTRQHQVGMGACAILVPTNHAGQRLANRLRGEGLRASFVRGSDIDLSSPDVKVITLHSAKGLEFTSVAIAGFFDGQLRHSHAAHDPARHDDDARRLMFVGMTRAMRSLLVICPQNGREKVPNGCSEDLWDIDEFIRR
jgi:superfamily I DNA/RNA helicase/mRNA-degrading endonuclease RelE of RelBE toxin-antitoxin system